MKVVLVDDHQILTDGIHRLLNTPFEVVATFSNPLEALAFMRTHEVDLLVTDYEMPGINGIELFTRARELRPLLKGVLLTMHDEASVARRAIKAGLQGFLLKNASQNELSLALGKVRQGHSYISPEITARLLEPEKTTQPLSERERQVLQLIIKEYTNKQIADALHLSERTVETYRKNLFAKANTNNIVGLVKYAYAHKLVE